MGIGHVLAARGQVPAVLGQAAGGAAGNGLLNNLIAYWPGNEASGNAFDLHTNALHLTDVNIVTSNPGLVYALARQYTIGLSQYHRRATNALLETGNVDFTIAQWVWLDALTASERWPSSKGTGGAWEWYLNYTGTGSANRMRFVIRNAEVVLSTIGITAGAWYLVSGWHDALNGRIGVSVNTTTNDAARVTPPSAGAADFRIGWGTTIGVISWNGRIGPTMFWKSAPGGGGVLTADQRTALYNGGAGLTYAEFTT